MAQSKGSSLTILEQQAILDKHKDGLLPTEIARQINRSYQSVYRVLQRGKTRQSKRKTWTQREQERLEEMLEAGHSDLEIAKELQRPVHTIINKRGMTKQRRKIPTDTAAEKKWQDFINKTDDELEEGVKYRVTINNLKAKENQWVRPMVYEGKQEGAGGIEFYMFRSSTGGWREALTIQQVRERNFEKVK
jgi:IS30 family transposase